MNLSKIKMHLRVWLLSCLGLLPLGGASAFAQELQDGDFEGPFISVAVPADSKGKVDGEIAQGWRDESAWGDVSIAYSRDVAGGHNGTAAQKIEVRSSGGGTPQFVQELKFKQGSIYHVTAWVKAASPGYASLMLRQAGSPYDVYGETKINLTTEWTQVEVTGTATAGDNGLVMFLPKGPGTYWLDDVTLAEVTSMPTATTASPSNTAGPAPVLQNPGMEGTYLPVTPPTSLDAKIEGVVAPGWLDESGWGEVSIAYSKDESVKHGGEAAQKIEVRSIGKGGAQFIQKLPFQADRVYHATAWIKASAPAEATFFLRRAGPPYTNYCETKVQLTTEWTKVELSGEVISTEVGYLAFSFSEAGTYWIDDVTLDDVTDGAKSTADASGAVNVALINGDFSGKFQPYTKSPTDKGQVEGELAEGWADDSAWGDVSVVYGRDETVSNYGKTSQRIEVKALNKGAVQFSQEVFLKKKRIYRMTAYLRGLINTKMLLQIRQKGSPYKIYGSLSASISPEWHKYEVFAQMDEDADGILNFCPSEVTTYWVADVKLEDVTDAVGAQVSQPGNLLANGSFEAGLSEGWLCRVTGFDDNAKAATWQHLDLVPHLDSTTASDGKSSLLITLGPWSGGTLSSPLVPSKFGQSYTASIAIKSESAEQVNLSLAGTTSSATVDVGPEWKRYSVTGSAVLGGAVQLHVRCVVKDSLAPVNFWLDGAMVEEGKAASANYIAPFPMELALTMDRPGSIVFDGEAAPLKLAIGGDLPKGAKLKWSVENLAGQVTELPPVALPASLLTIEPNPEAPRGLFKVRAQIVDKNGAPLSARIQKIFARLPPPRELTAAQALNSYFGAHVELTPEKLAIAKATGNRWIRMHDAVSVTLWPNIEVSPGVWTWNDEGIKAAKKAGLNILGVLGGAPNREALKPQAETGYFSSWNVPDKPGALEDWTEYVKQTVTHYQSMISYWEVWNEPFINGATSGFFPNGTPEQYGELLKLASPAIRAANSKATIVGVCSPGSDSPWLARALAVAGPNNFDAMSFHWYGGRLQGGEKSQIGGIVDELNAVQARYGSPKPLWSTEGGPTDNISWYVNPASAMHLQMSSIVRLDVAQIAAGIARFFPYTMSNVGEYGAGDLAEMEYDRALKPIIAARAVLASFIDGATYVNRTEPVSGAESHTFRQADGSSVQVVWSYDAKQHSIDVPKGMEAFDILGNPLKGAAVQVSEEPIYLCSSIKNTAS